MAKKVKTKKNIKKVKPAAKKFRKISKKDLVAYLKELKSIEDGL